MARVLRLERGAISIHASRGGSDRQSHIHSSCKSNFNPRFPRGKRLPQALRCLWSANFNPRFPRGKRRNRPEAAAHCPKFQSTLPAGEATVRECKHKYLFDISIHASRGGSDWTCHEEDTDASIISIHASRGGSDFMACVVLAGFKIISIHASRGGSDL